MNDFTLEDLFTYRRKGAGKLVDAYEQLQQRNAELEMKLTHIEQGEQATIVHQRVKIDELAATVERLRDQYERKDLVWFQRCEVSGLDPEQVGFIDLNAVKREVALSAYEQGFNDVWNEDFFDEFDEHQLLAKECAVKYANTKYSIGGE